MVIGVKDAAYLIVSNIRVEKVFIISEKNGLYTVKLSSTGGAIRVMAKRLYSTQEEAEAVLKERNGNVVVLDTTDETETSDSHIEDIFHSPHYYGWY